MRVALTGITGVLGRSLAPRLVADPQISELRGLARRPLPGALAGSPNVRHFQMDLASPEVDHFLEGADVLIHAAFQCYGTDVDGLYSVNVDAGKALIDRAVAAGIGHIVYISSVAAYGAHADNPLPLTEESTIRPNPGSWYSAHNALVEQHLNSVAGENGVTALAVRPVVILGADMDTGAESIRRYYPRFVPVFKGDKQLFQFVAMDDACEAIARAVVTRMTGALNVTGDSWLTPEEVAGISGGRLVRLPPSLKKFMVALNRIGVAPVGQERIELCRWPMVISNGRLRQELGVEPASSRDVLTEFFAAEIPH